MRKTSRMAGIMAIAAALAAAGAATAAERFDVLAWVDHHDFAGVRAGDGFMFDCEKPEGWAKILDHVQEVGTTVVLWRNCGGANMRYNSRVESHHHDLVLDKRRIPESRYPYGWVHFGDAEQDMIATVVEMCRQRGPKPGVHWPFEETHWSGWTIGGWNLEHPQYWARTTDGQPWWGRTSLGFEEVRQHKLALLDELLERGVEVVFVDFFRTGGWSPAYEYVEPVIAAYRTAYGEDPPADPTDLRWCRHVAGYVTDLMRAMRERMDATGRKIELLVGIPGIAPLGDQALVAYGADWRRWVEKGIVDGVVINYVEWDPKDPFESTRRLGREVRDAVQGRCPVYWPVRAYDYGGFGMPSYQKATELGQDEVAARLMEMAWEEGAAGVSLECVDYNNYAPTTRERMREATEGKCRWRREAGGQ